MARRYDSSKVTKAERTPQGYLRVEAPITRAGIFEYRRADGSTYRELRRPENVFHGDSLRTFDGVPLVNTTEVFDKVPPGHTPLLTAENTGKYQKGFVTAPRSEEGRLLTATIIVTDPGTIADIEGGKRELSCGYSCDVVEEAGEWNGQRYDAVQENIVGNHVALVRKGRAGSEVAIRLDSADAELVASDEPAAGKEPFPVKTKKLKFDSAEVEIEESLAALIESERAKTSDALKSATAETAKQTARGDSAEAALSEVRKQLDSAPAKIREELKTEMELHGRARKVLGAEVKLDGQNVEQVQRSVLAKLDVKVEGKDATYIAARFDAEMERFEAGAGGTRAPDQTLPTSSFDALDAAMAAMKTDANTAFSGK